MTRTNGNPCTRYCFQEKWLPIPNLRGDWPCPLWSMSIVSVQCPCPLVFLSLSRSVVYLSLPSGISFNTRSILCSTCLLLSGHCLAVCAAARPTTERANAPESVEWFYTILGNYHSLLLSASRIGSSSYWLPWVGTYLLYLPYDDISIHESVHAKSKARSLAYRPTYFFAILHQ
jgi:hypothetical protein